MSENQNQNLAGIAPLPVTEGGRSATRPAAPPAPPPGDPPSSIIAPPSAFTPARGESARAFEAFRAYLELGPRRRYAAAACQVGAPLRTVKRWAVDFNWRGRVSSVAAQSADRYVQARNELQREELLDDVARARTFRDRQFALAEAILDIAERHLERVEDEDLDRLSLTDTCKALELASRLIRQAGETEAAAPDQPLRDQLAALLDRASAEPKATAQNDDIACTPA